MSGGERQEYDAEPPRRASSVDAGDSRRNGSVTPSTPVVSYKVDQRVLKQTRRRQHKDYAAAIEFAHRTVEVAVGV